MEINEVTGKTFLGVGTPPGKACQSLTLVLSVDHISLLHIHVIGDGDSTVVILHEVTGKTYLAVGTPPGDTLNGSTIIVEVEYFSFLRSSIIASGTTCQHGNSSQRSNSKTKNSSHFSLLRVLGFLIWKPLPLPPV
jgi:hypothetical protein